MRRHILMIAPKDATTPITLRDIEQRVERLLGQLDVPPDAVLTEWYNPHHLRDELVFEVPTPITAASLEVLLDSVQRKLGAEYKDDDARAEISRRYGVEGEA